MKLSVSWNMPIQFVAEAGFHLDRSDLNAFAPLNMKRASWTLLMSQLDRSWLNK